MRLAFAQMAMSDDMEENFKKTIKYIEQAAIEKADMICFPEVQLTKFFPQYQIDKNTQSEPIESQITENNKCNREIINQQSNDNNECYKKRVHDSALTYDNELFVKILKAAQKNKIWVVPNFYFYENKKYYDMSFLISSEGEVAGTQKMVHIAQADKFFEQDYYTPSEEGFNVFDTPFGKIGIVVCFDRHIPESIRTQKLKGAKLIIIPTANTKEEDMELFECEMRTESYHNGVIIAMCNRVGNEDEMNFAGESIVTLPDGSVLYKMGDKENIGIVDIDDKWFTHESIGDMYIRLRKERCYYI